MRSVYPSKLEAARETRGLFATEHGCPNGRFILMGPCGSTMMIVAVGAFQRGNGGWEHVSVSLPGKNRCPNWPEMCFVKDLFWDEEDAVIQVHPPRSEYVNNHPFCLHLWRPEDGQLRMPSSDLVGLKHAGEMTNAERMAAAIAIALNC